MGNETSKQDETKALQQDHVGSNVRIFLYYNGAYAMKYENLKRDEADKLLIKWNSIEYPGWLAKEQ